MSKPLDAQALTAWIRGNAGNVESPKAEDDRAQSAG